MMLCDGSFEVNYHSPMKPLSFLVILSLAFSVLPPLTSAGTESIIISEVLANAVDEDTGEFIELYNDSDDPINIDNWILSDLVDQQDIIQDYVGDFDFGVEGTTIPAHGYALIVDPEYAGEYQEILDEFSDEEAVIIVTVDDTTLGNGLGNSSDTLHIMSPDIMHSLEQSWSNDTGNGTSMGRIAYQTRDPLWLPSAHESGSTPGFQNNVAPEASLSASLSEGIAPLEIEFDASDSHDPEELPLQFHIDYGDGDTSSDVVSTHIYENPGNFTARLTVTDIEGSTNMTKLSIEINAPQSCDLRVSEILPNPVGEDAVGEFIEVENYGNNSCDLSEYKLNDSSSSAPYLIGDEVIAAKSYKAFMRTETDIALNNNGETARLFDQSGNVISEVAFQGSAKEGYSLAWNGEAYAWIDNPTPNAKNIFPEAEPEEEPDKEDDLPEDDQEQESEETLKRYSIAEVRSLEKGSEVLVEGSVTVLPGTLSKKYLYISDGVSGIQVYSSKENFPKLTLGDRISVKAKLSESGGEKRVLVKDKNDLQIIGKKYIAPKKMATGSIDESTEGILVAVQGKLVKKYSSGWYIDDGSGQTKITIDKDTGITKPDVKNNEWITVAGVVSETSAGYRILPRSQDDILMGKQIEKLTQAGSSLFGFELLFMALLFTVLFRLARRQYAHQVEA